MSDEDELRRLRKLAAGATPGPWGISTQPDGDGEMYGYDDAHGDDVFTVRRDRECNEYAARDGINDARYIAAVSPDVVTALLDRLQQAEAVVERVRELLTNPHYGWWHTGGTKCVAGYAITDALDGDA